MKCRKFLNVLLAICFVGFMGITGALAQQAAPLNPTTIPQFVDPLPLLSAQGSTIETVVAGTAQHDIFMREFKVNVLPASVKLPKKVPYAGTWVWGYRTSATAVPALTDTYTGPVFVATRNIPTQIKWVNNLPSGKANSNLPFWWASIDQSLHWADPNNLGMPMMPLMCSVPPAVGDDPRCFNYDGPVPAVVHLHGGEVPPQIDGGPDQWFTSAGLHGPQYYTKAGAGAAPNEAVYRYPPFIS